MAPQVAAAAQAAQRRSGLRPVVLGHPAHGGALAFGADGALYVETDSDDAGDRTNGMIWQIDRRTGAGTILARNLGRPRGLLALPDGRLVMVDNEHHVVRLLDPATREVTELAGERDAAVACWRRLAVDEPDGESEARRYRLYESIHAYAAEKLDELDVPAAARDRHARWFAEARQADEIDPNAMTLATAT